MKRFIIFLILLIAFAGLYNFPLLKSSFLGFLGDDFYQKSDFSHATEQYTDILKTHSSSPLLEADILYNLGNTFYRLGEKEKDSGRIKFWEEAIGSYTKSLSLRTDSQTEENLAFVKEKLQQEQKKQEEKKKQEQEAKTASGSENQQKQTGKNKDSS
jgi:tetratricopeptide (TPR) repeat protein